VGKRPGERLDRVGSARNDTENAQKAKEVEVHRGKVDTGLVEVPFEEGVFVGSARRGGGSPVGIDNWIVSQRLDEDGVTPRSENSGDLAISSREVQMVDDAASEHEVEAVVGEGQGLRIHAIEGCVSEAGRLRLRIRLFDADRAQVDAAKRVNVRRKAETNRPCGTAILKDVLASTKAVDEFTVSLEHRLHGGVEAPLARACLLGEALIVEGLLTLESGGVGQIGTSHSATAGRACALFAQGKARAGGPPVDAP